MAKFNIYLFAVLSLIMAACGSDDNDVTTPECPVDLLCTEQFEIITVTVTENGEPVTLDNFKTVNMANGKIYDFQGSEFLEPGVYILVTDGQFDEIAKDGTSLRFEGSIQDAVVVDEIFEVGHDCCHVLLVDGDLEIQL